MVPQGCTSTTNCKVFVTFKPGSDDETSFEIGTNRRWAGFGLVPNSSATKMTGLKGHVCVLSNGNAVLSAFHASGKKKPDGYNKSVVGVWAVQGSSTNGWTSCKFKRKVNVPPESSTWMYDMGASSGHLSIIAYGKDSAMDVPVYHGFGNYFSALIDLTKVNSSTVVEDKKLNANIVAHG